MYILLVIRVIYCEVPWQVNFSVLKSSHLVSTERHEIPADTTEARTGRMQIGHGKLTQKWQNWNLDLQMVTRHWKTFGDFSIDGIDERRYNWTMITMCHPTNNVLILLLTEFYSWNIAIVDETVEFDSYLLGLTSQEASTLNSWWSMTR